MRGEQSEERNLDSGGGQTWKILLSRQQKRQSELCALFSLFCPLAEQKINKHTHSTKARLQHISQSDMTSFDSSITRFHLQCEEAGMRRCRHRLGIDIQRLRLQQTPTVTHTHREYSKVRANRHPPRQFLVCNPIAQKLIPVGQHSDVRTISNIEENLLIK